MLTVLGLLSQKIFSFALRLAPDSVLVEAVRAAMLQNEGPKSGSPAGDKAGEWNDSSGIPTRC